MPTAGAVMDQAAALLNDPSKVDYTYTVQLPYLKSAYNKLQLRLHSLGLPVIEEISSTIDVAINATTVTYPADLVQPIKLEERLDGTSDLFVKVEKIDDIPEMDPVSNIMYWNWREEVIYINPPTTAREVLLKYFKSLTAIADQSTNIPVINSLEYLANKTAALCARFIGENPTRADSLDILAAEALDLLLGNEIKNKQNQPKRPKGYGYRRRQSGLSLI